MLYINNLLFFHNMFRVIPGILLGAGFYNCMSEEMHKNIRKSVFSIYYRNTGIGTAFVISKKGLALSTFHGSR